MDTLNCSLYGVATRWLGNPMGHVEGESSLTQGMARRGRQGARRDHMKLLNTPEQTLTCHSSQPL